MSFINSLAMYSLHRSHFQFEQLSVTCGKFKFCVGKYCENPYCMDS